MKQSITKPPLPGKRVRGYELRVLRSDYVTEYVMPLSWLSEPPLDVWQETCQRRDILTATLIQSGRTLLTHNAVRQAAMNAQLVGTREFCILR